MPSFEVVLDAAARPAFADPASLPGARALSLGAGLELLLAAVREGRAERPFELHDLRIVGPIAIDRIAALRCTIANDRAELSCVLLDHERSLQAETPFLNARIAEPGEVGAAQPVEVAWDEGVAVQPELEALGLMFPDGDCVLARVRRSEAEIEADIVPQQASDLYVADPALLDAALMLLHLSVAGEQAGLPCQAVTIERLSAIGQPTRVQRLRLSAAHGPFATLWALDAANRPVFVLQGVRTVHGPTLHALRSASLGVHLTRLLPTVIADCKLDPTSDLVRLGVTSLELVRLASALRDELGCELALSRMAEDPRIDAIAAACAEAFAWTPIAAEPAPASASAAQSLPSFAQEQIWYLEQLGGLGPTYHEGMGLHVHGRLEPAAMRRAFERVVRRHAALLACFADGRDGPIRRPSQQAPSFELLELPGEALSQALEARTELVRELVRRPFDLERGPLVRALLVVGADSSLLVLAAHHIVVDGWSLRRVVLSELAETYTALVEGRIPTLGEAADFDAFVAWERSHVARRSAEGTELAWWQQALADMPDLISLPLDARRGASITHAGGRVTRDLSAECVAAVQRVSVSLGVTPFALYFAAFALLLAKYGRQTRLVLGMVSANRVRREHESTVGMLANLLPVGLELHWDASVAGFIQEVGRRVYAALDHQSLPFSSLVSGLARPRIEGANPLVQVALAFEEPWPVAQLAGAAATPFPVSTDSAKLDLVLTLRGLPGQPATGGALATFEFRRDLFAPSTIDALAEAWCEVLATMLAKPELQLGEVPSLSPARTAAAQAALTGPERAPESLWIHEAFERCAKRTPEALALTTPEQAVSYATLNERADRIADLLVQRGIAPGARVGVRMARTPQLVAALLGILKAGAAYVPLDRELPRARVLHLMADAEVALLLCDADEPEDFPNMLRGLAQLTAPHGPGRDTGAARPVGRLPASALAYVLYTSGTTGMPKGVLVEHGNVAHLMASLDAFLEPTRPGSWLAGNSLAFDASVVELWWPLSRGQRVVLHGGWASGHELPSDAGITHLCCTPTVLGWLLDQPTGHALVAGLSHLFLGGEVLTSTLARRIRSTTRARITNGYGPSEGTVCCTTHEVRDEAAPIPIGRPLENVALRVVDPCDHMLPHGAHGELLIAGPGVARGYTGDPALTRASFFEALDAAGGMRRWYRSGDLVRQRPDGTLEYLGRLDRQIKVRGQRVEPAEIEAAIRTQPAVLDCAVELREVNGAPRLVGFVQARQDCTAAEMHAWLRLRLPGALIPHRFVWLAELPRNVAGKLDRTALQRWPLDTDPDGTPSPDPGTELERAVAEVLGEVLGGPKLRLDDDFFVVGGDSLSALRAVSALHERLDLHIALRTVVSERTARAIARSTRQAAPAPTPAQLPVAMRCRPVPRLILHAQPCEAYALATRPDGEAGRRLARALALLPPPLPQAVLETPWGSLGVRVLGISDAELFGDLERHQDTIRDEIAAATAAGARAIALTGLLAAATEHGRRVAGRDGNVVTTGHASTCAAVIATLRRVLERTARPISAERVAVLGVGSIGAGTARLLAPAFGAPRELVLCDLPVREQRVSALARELGAALGDTKVRVHLAAAHGNDSPLYEASVIVGATSQAEVLDVARLRPGTLVVDDSAPHCVSVPRAVRRMHVQGDVLVCEGGSVQAPQEIECRILSELELDASGWAEADAIFGTDPREIMACALSARLMLLDPTLQPTLGEPTTDGCLAHARAFERLGIGPAPLRLGGYVLADGLVQALARYGTK